MHICKEKKVKKKVFIIAEAGVNHNNKINLAYKLVNAAKKSGADAVKFQVFKTENYISKNAPLAKYQKKNSKSRNQFEMIKKLELSEMNLKKIILYCKNKKIIFLASPFDLWGVDFLIKNKINPRFISFCVPSIELVKCIRAIIIQLKVFQLKRRHHRIVLGRFKISIKITSN